MERDLVAARSQLLQRLPADAVVVDAHHHAVAEGVRDALALRLLTIVWTLIS